MISHIAAETCKLPANRPISWVNSLIHVGKKQASNPMRNALLSAALLSVLASPTLALQPLHQNPTVISGFYAIGLADEVRKNCDTIEPRMFRAYNYLRSLERFAREAGYSAAQIEQLAENKVEKEKLRAQIREDLAKRGASPNSPEGYCTVGREEIANNSAAGRLLRLK